MIIEIPIPFRLYRCDSNLPPPSWDANFSLETNYGKKYGEKGPKNKAGLFFLHDHIDISNSYGTCRLKEINKVKAIGDLQTDYYITETKLKEPLKIIDFSNCHSMFMMIDVLMKNGINILTNEFKNHQNDSTFDEFLAYYNAVNNTGNSLHAIKIKLTNKDMAFEYSFFGQVLSDFDNGIVLKKNLQLKNIDGYRWREHNDPRGLTYCLLNFDKLSEPIVERVILL